MINSGPRAIPEAFLLRVTFGGVFRDLDSDGMKLLASESRARGENQVGHESVPINDREAGKGVPGIPFATSYQDCPSGNVRTK